MTTEQLRNEIIGPCTEEQKAEAREILIGMGDKCSGLAIWNQGWYSNIFYWDDYKEWDTTKSTPTLSFEEFKQQVQK